MSRVLAAVTLVLIGRQLGPDAYGQYSATLALVGLSTVVFALGLDGWLLYKGGREPVLLRVRFSSALVLKVGLGVMWLVGWWSVAPHLNQSSFPWVLVFLASLSLWLEDIAGLIWSAFKARLRNDLTLVLMVLSQGAFLVITLWLVSQHVHEPANYAGAKFLAALLGLVVSGLLALRTIGLRLRPRTLPGTLRSTLPFAASIAFTVIYGRADLAIVANELGKAAAGVYAPALTLTNALFLIPGAVFGVMVPILGRGYTEDRAWLKRIFWQLLLIMVVVGLVLGIGLGWASHFLINTLYGADFGASGDILQLLSVVLVLRCPTIALAAVLIAVGWQTWRVGTQAIAALLNVALNFLVVHYWGVKGVAQVYILTEAVLLVGHLGLFFLWLWKEKRRTCP